MSYDLRLFEEREGVDAAFAYETLMQQEEAELVRAGDEWMKRSLPEPTRKRMQQLADALKAQWVRFVQFEPKSPLPWIELNDESFQVQVSVYEDSVSITMPYFRQATAQMMDCLGCCIKVCPEQRGYAAFDPQLWRTITADDREKIAQAYRRMDKSLPELRGETQSKGPIWKRLWSR
jgi:hypothetical protein